MIWFTSFCPFLNTPLCIFEYYYHFYNKNNKDIKMSGSEVHDVAYYQKCMVGGILSCGITHTIVCPLDIVKCRMQVCILHFYVCFRLPCVWGFMKPRLAGEAKHICGPILIWWCLIYYRQCQAFTKVLVMDSEASTPLKAWKVSVS